MNEEMKAIRKRVSDRCYAMARDEGFLQQCVAIGVVVHDSIERGLDPLHIAAEAERSAVLLACQMLERQ